MGTINWTLGHYSADRAHNVIASREVDSGQFTSSGTAADITSLEVRKGQVFAMTPSAACRVRFGGQTASASAGHYIGADQRWETEISEEDDRLAVSVIDV